MIVQEQLFSRHKVSIFFGFELSTTIKIQKLPISLICFNLIFRQTAAILISPSTFCHQSFSILSTTTIFTDRREAKRSWDTQPVTIAYTRTTQAKL